MSDIDTIGILEEIEALASDKLQVVSYKWLSRNYLVSSNAAKRLLQEFVEKYGKGFEVVYSLSGWLKNNPAVYHVMLVSGTKLAEAKQKFDGDCSIQVYSVQTCLPKDPATLWNAEFIQAEELFKQPSTVDNCLRDNRFCGILNSFVKRNTEGTPLSTLSAQSKNSAVPGSLKCDIAHHTVTHPQPQERKLQHSSPKVGLHSSDVVTDVKSNVNAMETGEQATKPPVEIERVHPLPANKKKAQNDKSSAGNGSSLANMWGRASSKSKTASATTDTHTSISNSNVSAEAQICAQEGVEDGNSDDDGDRVHIKRTSNGEGNRKRRVVFDFSDEENDFEDAVNLASPDAPKGKSYLDMKTSAKTLVAGKINLNFDSQNEHKQTVKEEKANDHDTKPTLRQDSEVVKIKRTALSSSDKIQINIPETDMSKKDKVVDMAPTSPKRRKVLKTRIDERGREVTEVIWDGEDTDSKKADTNVTKNDNSTATNPVNRAPATNKKLPALGSSAPSNPSGKGGNKKVGNAKDPKQGSIMSFFKKA